MSELEMEDEEGNRFKLSFYNDSIELCIKDVDDACWSGFDLGKHDVVPLINTLLEYITPPMI